MGSAEIVFLFLMTLLVLGDIFCVDSSRGFSDVIYRRGGGLASCSMCLLGKFFSSIVPLTIISYVLRSKGSADVHIISGEW